MGIATEVAKDIDKEQFRVVVEDVKKRAAGNNGPAVNI